MTLHRKRKQGTILKSSLPDVGEFPKEALLGFEKEVLGVYISGHPLEEYEEKWRKNISADHERFYLG